MTSGWQLRNESAAPALLNGTADGLMLGYRAMVGMTRSDGRVSYIMIERFEEYDGDPLRTLERWTSGESGVCALLAFGDLDGLYVDRMRAGTSPRADVTALSGATREARDASAFHGVALECAATFAALHEDGGWLGWVIPMKGSADALAKAEEETSAALEYVRRAAQGFNGAEYAPERRARELRAAARTDAGLASGALRRATVSHELRFMPWIRLVGGRHSVSDLASAESMGVSIAHAKESLRITERNTVRALERIRQVREQVEHSLRGEPLWVRATKQAREDQAGDPTSGIAAAHGG